MSKPTTERVLEIADYLINELHLGDFIYNVRERLDEQWFRDNPDKPSWEHPKVVKFSDVVSEIEGWLKADGDA